MNGILKKFIEVTDRIALVGVPDEKRKPEYRRRRENFAERNAVAEETAPELTGPAPAIVEQVIEQPAEKPAKSMKKNKPIDLLAAKPPEETAIEIPPMLTPAATTAATEVVPAPAQVTPPAPNTENSVASEKSGGKGEDKSSGLGNLMDLFKQIETEEESPLQHLIASLPDITATELLCDIKEVEGLIRAYVNIH